MEISIIRIYFMKLSEENKQALLLQIRQIIYEATHFTNEKLKNKEEKSLSYFGLTDEENELIDKLKSNPLLQNTFEKILSRNLDDSFFSLLCIIDGVSEPLAEFGKKSDFLLIDKPDDFDDHYDFLHDEFYESYDIWEKINKLDI
tara:strand:+ start:4334 stop:4768 length:435 start_codon:yes stop_codon:yes gene_type:complete